MKNVCYPLAGSILMTMVSVSDADADSTIEDFSEEFLQRIGVEVDKDKALSFLEQRIPDMHGKAWQTDDLATEEFVAQFQASIQTLLKDISLDLGIDPPPTLSLNIFELEPAPQSIFIAQNTEFVSGEATANPPPTPPKMDSQEMAELRSTSRGPVLVQSPGAPMPPVSQEKSSSSPGGKPAPHPEFMTGEMPPPPPGGFDLPDVEPELDQVNKRIVPELSTPMRTMVDSTLEAKLKKQPRVRVIVSLRPNTENSQLDTDTVPPEEIYRVQEQVFGEMPEDFLLIHRYESVLAFAAEVGPQALEKLKNHKLVAQIVADFEVDLTPPGNPQ